jgi:DNA-directed RNA polymerase specialized sigma24 family protein
MSAQYKKINMFEKIETASSITLRWVRNTRDCSRRVERRRVDMQTVSEALDLLKRQAELEAAMRQPGGIRVTEEQELHAVRRRLAQFPEAMRAVVEAAQALRRPVSEVSAREVESWASGIRQAASGPGRDGGRLV